jgi:predicted NUDIX family NTP pyrophosphohydrolase
MAKNESAGLLVWRRAAAGPQFLLAHPGGPYWRGKDAGAWSIPKGLIDPGEENAAAAVREFEEEVGQAVSGVFTPLRPVRLKSGKRIFAWLVEADLDLAGFRSNTFEMEWPPRSGRRIEVPEIDEVGWFDAQTALAKLNPAQGGLVLEALQLIAADGL